MSHTYTLRDIASMMGLSRGMVTRLVAAGFVTPSRGPRREYRFSFQDVVLLRAAHGLHAAEVPPRRILRSLRQLRERLPAEMPLSGLRITAVGSDVVVQSGGAPWQPESGQLLFDFGVTPTGATVREWPGAPTKGTAAACPPERAETGRAAASDADAAGWFRRAVALETSDRAAAEGAYRRAIAEAPAASDAYLNLGVMLGEAGRHAEAAMLYREGIRHCPGEALLHFNLAVALEDLGEAEGALEAYERALALAPAMADAHFNAGRLYDRTGRLTEAIRHYSAYRRLRKEQR